MEKFSRGIFSVITDFFFFLSNRHHHTTANASTPTLSQPTTQRRQHIPTHTGTYEHILTHHHFQHRCRPTSFQVARGLHSYARTVVSCMMWTCSFNKEWTKVHAHWHWGKSELRLQREPTERVIIVIVTGRGEKREESREKREENEGREKEEKERRRGEREAPRVQDQNVPVCRFKWPLFVPAKRAHVFNRWNRRRSTSETIHLNEGSSWTKRRTRSFSRRIRRTLFSKPSTRWLNTGRCRNAERRITSCPDDVHRRYQNNTYVTWCIVGKTYWRLLERGWNKRIIWCKDRFRRFILLNDRPLDGFSWSGEETHEETNNLKTRQRMARYVEAYV